jgi:hypothetical protein
LTMLLTSWVLGFTIFTRWGRVMTMFVAEKSGLSIDMFLSCILVLRFYNVRKLSTYLEILKTLEILEPESRPKGSGDIRAREQT